MAAARVRPLVTVLLPCYNAARYLAASLESLVNQTYAALEILAIDDGSTDATGKILAEFARRDARVRLAPNDRNRGLIYTLNRGVALATGSLIARMDADDVSLPQRIERQAEYFERFPETQLLSSDVSYIREDGELLYDPVVHRFSDSTLRFPMFFTNPICHPTIMARTSTMRSFEYSPSAVHSEDFELWTRMLEHGVVFRNVPERLLRFRPNLASVSTRHFAQQSATFLRVSAAAMKKYFDFDIDPDVHRILTARMSHGDVRGSKLREAMRLFHYMWREYVRRESLSRDNAAVVTRFALAHIAKVLHLAYRRSASEDPARGAAAWGLLRVGMRSPGSVLQLVVNRLRSRARDSQGD